jgi:hypothetical protein
MVGWVSRLGEARELVRAQPVPRSLRRLGDDGLSYYDGASRWTRTVTRRGSSPAACTTWSGSS